MRWICFFPHCMYPLGVLFNTIDNSVNNSFFTCQDPLYFLLVYIKTSSSPYNIFGKLEQAILGLPW